METPMVSKQTRPTPKHIGIIMDGNQRWARQKSLPAISGHRAGARNIRRVAEACAKIGIPCLTLFAFSTENWRRPPAEVNWLLKLLDNLLQHDAQELHSNNIKFVLIGDRGRFSDHLQRRIADTEELTRHNTRLSLQIAASYGGRWDIAMATRKLVMAAMKGEIDPNEIDEEAIGRFTSLAELPALDLCIRTGGEQRLSNFLLWDLAYSELYFTPTYWPDFDQEDLARALSFFGGRHRRFGRN